MNRRRFLAGSSACLTVLSGCLGPLSGGVVDAPGEPTEIASEDGSGRWAQYAHDARNTGFAPGVSGPEDDPEVVWTAFGDRPLSAPVVDEHVFLSNAVDGETLLRWRRTTAPSSGPAPPRRSTRRQ